MEIKNEERCSCSMRLRNTSFGKPIHINNIDNEKTLCNLCGKETPYLAAQKCSLCWEMEQGLRMLADKDKSKAIKWLEDNLKELKGVK